MLTIGVRNLHVAAASAALSLAFAGNADSREARVGITFSAGCVLASASEDVEWRHSALNITLSYAEIWSTDEIPPVFKRGESKLDVVSAIDGSVVTSVPDKFDKKPQFGFPTALTKQGYYMVPVRELPLQWTSAPGLNEGTSESAFYVRLNGKLVQYACRSAYSERKAMSP